MNQLILGDNLEIMRKMDSESIDLIYLDPPFFSNRNYEVIWGDKGEVRSFEDRWSGGIDHYIAWLKERVAEMHRLLKSSGSIYLHCDWHAFAEIKVFILDNLFGNNNFINDIIWCYTAPANVKNRFPQKHDTIYLYSKNSKNYYFSTDSIKIPYHQETIARTGRGAGMTGLKVEGNIEERHKNRLDKDGKVPEDYWIDIFRVQGNGSERIGYPTQKPEKLLERIIFASTKEDDIVLDPFVGGGTTIVVADKLKRQWIGIDQSVQAIKVSEMRLNNQQNLFSAPFSVQLHKYDYDTLRYKDAFDFEKWIVERFEGVSNIKQRSDLGLDGKKRDGTPIQVKRTEGIGRNVVDNFHSAVMRNDKALYEKNKLSKNPVGYIIAFSFGKGAIQEVARLKNIENIFIRLVTVDEIVPIAKKPKLIVQIVDLGLSDKKLREIEFTAIGESNSGIEFYSWDFEYNEDEKKFKASIMIDKEGIQTHKFKPGVHNIAVKLIDNEGLEAIEIVKVKVNGIVSSE